MNNLVDKKRKMSMKEISILSLSGIVCLALIISFYYSFPNIKDMEEAKGISLIFLIILKLIIGIVSLAFFFYLNSLLIKILSKKNR